MTEPAPSKEGWLRTSRYLKTRRPAPRVLLIAITNPPYNLLNGDVLYELGRVLKTLNIRETGAVILTSGLDDIFISHYDVQEIVDLGILPAKIGIGAAIPPSIIRGALWLENALEPFGFRYWIRRSPIAGLANLNTYHETTALLRSIPQVTIAAINGRAFGGGCELALACDFRVMVDIPPEGIPGEARGSGIGQPEITLGLMPGGGGTQMLSRMLGNAKALEICLLRTLIPVQEAYDLGLVTKVVPRDDLVKESVALASLLAKRAPGAVAAIKDCVHNGGSKSLTAGMRMEQGNFGVTAMIPETHEAMQKYIKQIDSLLGSEGGLDDFAPLQEGTFHDMIPDTVTLTRMMNKLQRKRNNTGPLELWRVLVLFIAGAALYRTYVLNV